MGTKPLREVSKNQGQVNAYGFDKQTDVLILQPGKSNTWNMSIYTFMASGVLRILVKTVMIVLLPFQPNRMFSWMLNVYIKIELIRIVDYWENRDKWELKQRSEDNRGAHRQFMK